MEATQERQRKEIAALIAHEVEMAREQEVADTRADNSRLRQKVRGVAVCDGKQRT